MHYPEDVRTIAPPRSPRLATEYLSTAAGRQNWGAFKMNTADRFRTLMVVSIMLGLVLCVWGWLQIQSIDLDRTMLRARTSMSETLVGRASQNPDYSPYGISEERDRLDVIQGRGTTKIVLGVALLLAAGVFWALSSKPRTSLPSIGDD